MIMFEHDPIVWYEYENEMLIIVLYFRVLLLSISYVALINSTGNLNVNIISYHVRVTYMYIFLSKIKLYTIGKSN